MPVIGLRINPQTGSGDIEIKYRFGNFEFGFGLADPGSKAEIVEAYMDRPRVVVD